MGRLWLVLVLACATLGAATASARGTPQVRIGLVLNEDSVGRSSDPVQYELYTGLKRAVFQLHVVGRAVSVRPNGTYMASIAYLTRQRFDLVIGAGFQQVDAMDAAARRFPASKFALLDARREDLPHKPANVEGSVFRTEQAGYLGGYLAAKMVDRRSGPHVISSVGGASIPQVNLFIAGFQAGARAADAKITTLNAYSNDFVDQSKCAEIARAQVARGSRVVFDVAGGCGLGALAVAKRSGVWGIGVDLDQSYLGSFVLTSVIKRFDVAVYNLAREVRDGTFRTGGDKVFDLRNHGVGLGKFGPAVPASLRRRLGRLREQILAGRIHVPTTIR